MPTGYTADVQSGKVTDFRTFALRCARAFGACILQRDDPMGDLPKPREVSEFYRTNLLEAQARYDAAQHITTEGANQRAVQQYTDEVDRRSAREAENRAEQQRYRDMLAATMAWTPPTREHDEFKRFMVKQLTDSMEFDSFRWPTPTLLSGEEWLRKERADAVRGLARATESLNEEIARCETANAWIAALENSLGAVTSPHEQERTP